MKLKLEESLQRFHYLQELADSDDVLDNEILVQAKQEITQNADRVVFAYKARQQEIENIKHALRTLVHQKKKSLDRFKTIVSCVLAQHGDIETPATFLKRRKRKSKAVRVLDFDLCMRECPAAVITQTEDNLRTVKIDKQMLSSAYAEKSGKAGFSIVDHEHEFVDMRVRTRGE